jgi:large subunit ribosomal protein L30
MAGKLRVTLRKSVVSGTREVRGTVRALGLHRIRETVELPDNPAVRGQVRAVRHLLSVEEMPAAGKSKDSGPATPTEETES